MDRLVLMAPCLRQLLCLRLVQSALLRPCWMQCQVIPLDPLDRLRQVFQEILLGLENRHFLLDPCLLLHPLVLKHPSDQYFQ